MPSFGRLLLLFCNLVYELNIIINQMNNNNLINEQIKSRIYLVNNQKVMLDSDLAILYGVQTKVLNQAVKRNIERFPKDFMFQLNSDQWAKLCLERESLRSQIVTLETEELIENTFLSCSQNMER
jgi:hypothetical protein